jgi:hypothetical protein
MYIDTEADTYSVFIDGVVANTDNGARIPISGASEGPDAPRDVTRIGGYELRHSNISEWYPALSIDMATFGAYSGATIDEIAVSGELKPGRTIAAAPASKYQSVLSSVDDVVYEYSADGGRSWKPMAGGVIPDAALAARVSVTCTDVYGVQNAIVKTLPIERDYDVELNSALLNGVDYGDVRSIDPGTTYTITASVNCRLPGKATVLFALYDALGKLRGMDSFEASQGENPALTAALTVPSEEGDYQIRAFVFNGLGNMSPLFFSKADRVITLPYRQAYH